MTPLTPRNRLRFVRGLLGPLGSPRSVLSVLVLAAGLAVIEIVGRRLVSDVGDAVLLIGLGLLLLLVIPLRGTDTAALGRRLEAWPGRTAARLKNHWPQVGVDFRDDPKIPQRAPRIVVVSSAALGFITLCAVAWNAWSPLSWRALVAPRIYLAWLLPLAVLWAGLLLAAVLSLFIALMTARHVLWLRDAPRAHVYRLVPLWLSALLAAGLLLPPEVAMLLGVAGVLLTLGMTRLLHVPRLALLWRTARDSRIAAASWTATLWQASALPMAALLVFLGVALGGVWTWWPTPPSTTPLTDALAVIATWCFGPGLLALATVILFDLKRLVSNNPAAPCPTTVHFSLETTRDERSRLERRLEERGWRIRYAPAEAQPTDVRLRLVDSHASRPLRGWPLAVSTRALEVPELLDLIARRDVVQRRRLLRRGLQRLFKMLRGRDFEQGQGFWIAPHLWFVSATTRDTEEDDLAEDGFNNEIGPPYARLFPLAVRHHVYVVLHKVEVDIILLEDGVRWSAFRQVLDRIFTHYDGSGGRIEERDFSGIVGVRVILHDLEPGGQLEIDGYPEPDYTDLARGRILHVFRDRGGPEDEMEPVPSQDTYVLVGV